MKDARGPLCWLDLWDTPEVDRNKLFTGTIYSTSKYKDFLKAGGETPPEQ